MYRIWYSTESFADFIINNTSLKNKKTIKQKLYESDAKNARYFHTMPDHIRKILYLDSPDLIVEREMEPIFSIEISTEAGTGHNAFQRFARIAASVENDVPAFYIYPEASIITRSSVGRIGWDSINPSIFHALEAVMGIYSIPALLFYYPTDFRKYPNAEKSSLQSSKGIRHDKDIINYPGCPDSTDNEMKELFKCINEVIDKTKTSVIDGRRGLLSSLCIRERRSFMQSEAHRKSNGKSIRTMSPLTATIEIPTTHLLNYLKQYEKNEYAIGELLKNRDMTVIYQVNAKFRGDPYPGAIAAIDYLLCREGKTYEDRKYNLVLAFGLVEKDEDNKTIEFSNKTNKDSSIKLLADALQKSEKHNLLKKDYDDLRNFEIPRYYMQMRYGSTYSKVKHIRVYSYFADAILFPDGSLWRDG